jgi:uncharacterized protein YeaO (DUF488 family)
MIRIKRIYDPPGSDDGVRILVDRLWPRGLRKDKSQLDLWLKDVAPSNTLRRWFAHDPAKWQQFRRRYFEELDRNPAALEKLVAHGRRDVTLLFGAKEPHYNNAAAIKEYLDARRREAHT